MKFLLNKHKENLLGQELIGWGDFCSIETRRQKKKPDSWLIDWWLVDNIEITDD